MKNTVNQSEEAVLRQKAEELFKKKLSKPGSQPTEADTQKLIHELEVHQIELEMQNEELSLARYTAQDAAEKYTDLYEFAPSGYFTLSTEGEIIELNLSGANMLGKERSRLKNSRFSFFISDDTKPDFDLFLGKVFKSKAKESCEVTLSTNGNPPFYFHLTGIVTGNEEQCLVTMIDITDSKRAEEALTVSESRYRRLFETAKDGILILDFETGKITDANPFIVEIIEYPLKEIIGKKLWEIGLFSNKEQSELAFTELKTKGYIRFDDMPIQTQNGKIIEVEFISNVYLVKNSKVIQCNIRDITDRKQTERKQELTSKVLSILNGQENWIQLINDILVEIKNYTGMEAVGIRLKKDEDFPYYVTKGFPEYFVQAEMYLCTHNEKGEIICGVEGKPYLECMCGNVISGRTAPSLPYFTEGGSFYSNNTSALIASTTEKERQSATRNRCNQEGYESVALIPLYSEKEIIGCSN